MNNNLVNMRLSKKEKYIINSTRRIKILEFLASNIWSTAYNLSLLIDVNHLEYTRRLMERMIEDGLIVKREFSCLSGKRIIYLLTDFGFLEIGYAVKPKFNFKTSHQNFIHSELVQQLQIIAMNKNLEWRSEKSLIKSKEYKSYPDGLLISNHQKISIELQRNRYSLEALKNKIAKCLADCLSAKFNKVLFVCADNLNAEVMQKALHSVTILKGKNHQDIGCFHPTPQKCKILKPSFLQT